MLKPAPSMTNAERQRQFQLAHPGYDRRRKARQRASGKARLALLRAQWALEAKQAQVAAQAQPSVLQQPAPLLMLPAPVVDPLTAEMNGLSAALAQRKAEHHAVPTDR